MTRTLSEPHRSRREAREDAALDIRDALRTHGEMTSRQLADTTRLGVDLVDSVCKEMAFCRELVTRRGGGRHRPNRWRLPGQQPESEAREVLRACYAADVPAELASWHDRPRVRAPHPFWSAGWVWIDHDGDLTWYLTERAA